MISIFASSLDDVIGDNGKIPWRSPLDMKWFRTVTKTQLFTNNKSYQNVVMMGKNTWDSFMGNPLPGRDNWVLSSNKYVCEEVHSSDENAKAFSSLECMLEAASIYEKQVEVFCIGGGKLYASVKPECIIATRLLANAVGNVKYIIPENYTIVEKTNDFEDVGNKLRFEMYLREDVLLDKFESIYYRTFFKKCLDSAAIVIS